MSSKAGSTFNGKDYRDALGLYATGVAVVTTYSPGNNLCGLTVNSFCSVSLEPPLVSWCLDKKSSELALYQQSKFFCVNVLSEDQVELSVLFASQSQDKFSEINIEHGIANIPMLTNCVSRFQCSTKFIYEGGDHLIFVGEVMEFDKSDKNGLLFHYGKYAASSPLSSI